MDGKRKTTWYASAERVGKDIIERQYGYFRDDPLLMQTLEAISTAVLILNKQRQLVYANKAFLQLAMYKNLDSLLGLRVGEALNCIHWQEMEGGCGTTEYCRECGAVRAILNGLEGAEDVQDCSISLNERNMALDLRIFTSGMEHRDESFLVFTVLDVASEKRSQVLERLFLHDVKNTVGSLVGYGNLLMGKPDLDFDTIRRTIINLSDSLMEELESYSQLKQAESLQLEAGSESFSTLAFLANIKSRYINTEVAKGKSILLDPGAEDVALVSDQSLLGRVMGNMVKNALEFITTGHEITLSSKKVEGNIRLSVHNPGFIPENVQLQIFQRSFSTKGLGRGLGTYSIRLLSEEYLQGKVGFSSSEEEGTLFYGDYPLALK